MRSLFLSHATQADGKFASKLAKDLERHDVSVWKAPDSIRPGEQWGEAINRGLESCNVMVTVLTPSALRSKWVATETWSGIERAHKNEVTFIPLKLEACEPPIVWKSFQMVSFQQDYDAGLKQLLGLLNLPDTKSPSLSGLRSLLGLTTNPTPATNPLWDLASNLGTSKPATGSEKTSKTFEEIFPNLATFEFRSDSEKGEAARTAGKYKEAIDHYTLAIMAHGMAQTRYRKTLPLGELHYRRGQCWMALDFENSVSRFDTQSDKFDISKPAPLWSYERNSTFGKYLFSMSVEFDKAQADFAKAKELGYSPLVARLKDWDLTVPDRELLPSKSGGSGTAATRETSNASTEIGARALDTPSTGVGARIKALDQSLGLRDHIKDVARSKPQATMLPCPVCDLSVSAKNLVKHFDENHAGRLRDHVKLVGRLKDGETILFCPVCNAKVKVKNLERHVEKTHKGSGT